MNFGRFLRNKKGTAEVIGTMMFVMILLFFFTEVYVWHDQNVREMNSLYADKMNAGMQIIPSGTGQATVLNVTATGSDVTLDRLWIDSGGNSGGAHVYADLGQIQVAPGASNSIAILFNGGYPTSDGYGGFNVTATYNLSTNTITVDYYLPTNPTFTVVNTLGIATST